jgi:hypothetical protein
LLRGSATAATPRELPSASYASATHDFQRSRGRTDLQQQQQLGHAELGTTQFYASALSARRRASVMALDFGGEVGREIPSAGQST